MSTVLCNKSEVFVYKLPPRQTSRAYRAADWLATTPIFTGKVTVSATGNEVTISILEKFTNELFVKSVLTSHPSPSFEQAIDSTRYFVLKVISDKGDHAFIGIGFTERNDAFDFSLSIQDFFEKEKKMAQQQEKYNAIQSLNWSLKEGETMTLNLKPNIARDGVAVSPFKINKSVCRVKLPPPSQNADSSNSNNDLFTDFQLSAPPSVKTPATDLLEQLNFASDGNPPTWKNTEWSSSFNFGVPNPSDSTNQLFNTDLMTSPTSNANVDEEAKNQQNTSTDHLFAEFGSFHSNSAVSDIKKGQPNFSNKEFMDLFS